MNALTRIHIRLSPEQLDHIDRQINGLESRANYIRRLVEEDRQLFARRRPSRDQQG